MSETKTHSSAALTVFHIYGAETRSTLEVDVLTRDARVVDEAEHVS